MIREKLELIQKLPESTAECDDGPEIICKPGDCTIRYDHPSGNSIKWVSIFFRVVSALRMIPDAACSEGALEAYSKICLVEPSNWLAGLRKNAGKDSNHIPIDSKHFIIYFDHYGSVEVIAKSFSVK